jgi:hypothetical protein
MESLYVFTLYWEKDVSEARLKLSTVENNCLTGFFFDFVPRWNPLESRWHTPVRLTRPIYPAADLECCNGVSHLVYGDADYV